MKPWEVHMADPVGHEAGSLRRTASTIQDGLEDIRPAQGRYNRGDRPFTVEESATDGPATETIGGPSRVQFAGPRGLEGVKLDMGTKVLTVDW